LILQDFLPGSGTNRHLQDTLRNKRFSRASGTTAAQRARSSCLRPPHPNARLGILGHTRDQLRSRPALPSAPRPPARPPPRARTARFLMKFGLTEHRCMSTDARVPTMGQVASFLSRTAGATTGPKGPVHSVNLADYGMSRSDRSMPPANIKYTLSRKSQGLSLIPRRGCGR